MRENKETADKYFCEIIQMKCPYDHFCHTCRLYYDYEKAREKSTEMLEKGGKNEVRDNRFRHTL